MAPEKVEAREYDAAEGSVYFGWGCDVKSKWTTLSAFVILAWPASAQAVIVTNLTTDTVVFNSSGFEHDAAGHEPFALLQKSAAAKPWKSAAAPWDEVILRTDRSVHPKPPPGGEGLKYLRTSRTAAGEGHPVARFASAQARPGDRIRVEFSLELPSDADATITLGHEGRGAIRALLRLHARTVQFHDGKTWKPVTPRVTWSPARWQDWTLEYVVGEPTFTVKVGDGPTGVADALEAIDKRGGGGINQIAFGHLREQTYSIDATTISREESFKRKTLVQASQDLPQFLQINWRTGPDLPQGVQTVGAGVVHDTLIWTGGFCSGGTLYPNNAVPGKPDRYPRGFVDAAWGLNLKDPAAAWKPLPKLLGAARQALSSAVVNDTLYVWGGFSYNDELTYKTGSRLLRSGNEWKWEPLPDLPWNICYAGAGAGEGKLFSFGGADVSRNPGGTYHTAANRVGEIKRQGSRLLSLDTADLRAGWQELPECPGTPRFMAGTAVVGGYFYVFGGLTGHDNPLKQVNVVVDNWRYHIAGKTWERLHDLPVASSRHPGSHIVYKDRYIVLVGGVPSKYVMNPDGTTREGYGRPHRSLWGRTMFSDVTVYDTKTGTFGRANPLPICNNMPTAVLHGDRLNLIGGECEGAELNGVHYGHHPDLLLIGVISVTGPK